MKITVTLSNCAGELESDSFEIAADHPDHDEAVNLGASSIIEGWILAAGDTITIKEG